MIMTFTGRERKHGTCRATRISRKTRRFGYRGERAWSQSCVNNALRVSGCSWERRRSRHARDTRFKGVFPLTNRHTARFIGHDNESRKWPKSSTFCILFIALLWLQPGWNFLEIVKLKYDDILFQSESSNMCTIIFNSLFVLPPSLFFQWAQGDVGASGLPGADGREGHPVSHYKRHYSLCQHTMWCCF